MASNKRKTGSKTVGKTAVSMWCGWILALLVAIPTGAFAQQMQALARLDLGQSGITARASGDVDIALKLTQPVPYRVFTLANPARLVVDFREVDFAGVTAKKLLHTDLITVMRTGLFRPGWSRMVLEMKYPMAVFSAQMRTGLADGTALVKIRLTRVSQAAFAASTGARGPDVWALPKPVKTAPPRTRQTGNRPLVVALDPGHGGIDPGAEYHGQSEANLMLTLARELKERLVRTGRYKVFLTRKENVFVSLQGRISRAREGGADILISLHANASPSRSASGTTVYTLSKVASNAAAAALAASHDRDDLLAGVDLSKQDNMVASVLMDMAHVETMPRSKSLAIALAKGIGNTVGPVRQHPVQSAGFSVLRAPDIPSVLIEFGFMTNPRDLARLMSKKWREKIITGMIHALDSWSMKDAAQARLLLK